MKNLITRITSVMVALLIMCTTTGVYAYTVPLGVNTGYDEPKVYAESAVVMNVDTGAILYNKNGNCRRYPASITKVLTSLVVLDKCKLDEEIVFTKEMIEQVPSDSSTAHIKGGMKMSVEDALYALMLASANEAGVGLAYHVAGSVDEFATLMNTKARELGCKSSNFVNPHGYPNEKHYTTAYDMALITAEASKNEELTKIMGTWSYKIKANDTIKDDLSVKHHARILDKNNEYYYKYAIAAKTGFAASAGNTLVTIANKEGHKLVCVVMKDNGATLTYKDTKKLLDWAYKQKVWYLSDNLSILESETITEEQKELLVNIETSYIDKYAILNKGDSVKTSFKFINSDDNTLGFAEVYYNNKLVDEVRVTYNNKNVIGLKYKETLNKTEQQQEQETQQLAKENKQTEKDDKEVDTIPWILYAFLILVCIFVVTIAKLK